MPIKVQGGGGLGDFAAELQKKGFANIATTLQICKKNLEKHIQTGVR